jgi:hypothetical protein
VSIFTRIIDNAARDVALEISRKFATHTEATPTSGDDFLGRQNKNDQTVEDAAGNILDAIPLGDPSDLTAAIKVNDTTAFLLGENLRIINLDGGKHARVLLRSNANFDFFIQDINDSKTYRISSAQQYSLAGAVNDDPANKVTDVKLSYDGEMLFVGTQYFRTSTKTMEIKWGVAKKFTLDAGTGNVTWDSGDVVRGSTSIDETTTGSPLTPSPPGTPGSTGGSFTSSSSSSSWSFGYSQVTDSNILSALGVTDFQVSGIYVFSQDAARQPVVDYLSYYSAAKSAFTAVRMTSSSRFGSSTTIIHVNCNVSSPPAIVDVPCTVTNSGSLSASYGIANPTTIHSLVTESVSSSISVSGCAEGDCPGFPIDGFPGLGHYIVNCAIALGMGSIMSNCGTVSGSSSSSVLADENPISRSSGSLIPPTFLNGPSGGVGFETTVYFLRNTNFKSGWIQLENMQAGISATNQINITRSFTQQWGTEVRHDYDPGGTETYARCDESGGSVSPDPAQNYVTGFRSSAGLKGSVTLESSTGTYNYRHSYSGTAPVISSGLNGPKVITDTHYFATPPLPIWSSLDVIKATDSEEFIGVEHDASTVTVKGYSWNGTAIVESDTVIGVMWDLGTGPSGAQAVDVAFI